MSVVKEETASKDISVFNSGGHFVQQSGNFGRGHNEENFCEIILNFDQWLRRRCRLEIFLLLSVVAIKLSRMEPNCTVLVRGIMGNIHLNLFY